MIDSHGLAVDPNVFPRFSGPGTFVRLPDVTSVSEYDIAVIGIPFDGGTSYRPGARFGPAGIRHASRHLRPQFHVDLNMAPLQQARVVDAGDVPCPPYSIDTSVELIERQAREVVGGRDRRLLALGGDHTIALPLLREVVSRVGPVALVHFDAHLDTWDTYFGATVTHGTVFRRAAEEGLLAFDKSIHVGIRGPLYDRQDLVDDAGFGFRIIRAADVDTLGLAGTIDAIRRRVGDAPVYVSIDIDVLDPAFAPGTGTPEIGGFSSRELLSVLRGLQGLPVVGADIVEVAPSYDHAEVTCLAAATIAFDLVGLMGGGHESVGAK